MAEFKVGQTIETTDGRKGIIKYIGDIHVAAGQFLGVELLSPTGKNDGSVKGERYFECPPEHGLFLRAGGIARVVSQPAPKAAPRPSIAPRPQAAPKPRPSSISGAKPPVKPPAPQKRHSLAPRDPFVTPKPPGRKPSVSSSSATSTPNRPVSTSSAAPPTNRFSRPPPNTARPTASSATSSAAAKASRDPNVDALETKIRHFEKQHAEDRDNLKALDHLKGERDRFEGIIQKLQGKCQTFHQEIVDLKAHVKSIEAENERLSRAEQESESLLELYTLDREMAEERAEQAEAELELQRARLEEQELELDILKSEGDLLTEGMTDEDKEAAGYYRLQTERDRLRQALLRLKEMTEETETDLKSRIRELETNQAQVDELKEQNTNLEATVVTSEATIEDLRQQLDAANDLDDIIEELSSQNQQLKDQIAEKDMAIKDLENLKELNDELEIHHIEQANELRVELDARDAELAEQIRKVTEQDTAIADQDLLITKFRDLVLDLQTKMTDAESSKTMSEEQAKDVTGRFNEVMELNRRLRNATLTTTVKTITSELQKLQATEAAEELEIVKHYLPDSPEVYKNDSLRAYFRAKRVSFKSSLTSSLMRTLTLPTGPTQDAEQPLHDLMRLDAVHQLTYLHLKSGQFGSAVGSSTLEQFVTFGPAYEELDPIEKTLERCLDSLKNDELNYKDISDSLRRSNQILQGVALDFKDALAARPEDEIIFRVSSIKANFELIKSTFDSVKACVHMLGMTDGDWEDGTRYVTELLSKPSEASNESIVATGKLVRALDALRNDSLYPRFPLGVEDIAQQDELVGRTARASQRLATDLTKFLISHHNNEPEVLLASEVSAQLKSLQGIHFANNELQNLANVNDKLGYWNEFASVLMNNVEIERGPAPWVIKAKEIEAAKKQTADAEKKLQVLTVEHHATMLQIREREEIIDTKELEIEHLKAKHREAVTKVEDLDRLQKELREAEKARERFQQEIKAQQVEISRLKERTALSERSEPIDTRPITPSGGTNPVAEKPVPQENASGTFITLVQALSNENHWLRQRENHEMFGHNLQAMFTKIRDFQVAQAKREVRRKQEKADEMLAMCMSLAKPEITETPRAITVDSDWASDAKLTPLLLNIPTRTKRQGPSPIMLTPLNSLDWHYSDMEDLSFEDLSPVAEEFEVEASEDFGELEGTYAF